MTDNKEDFSYYRITTKWLRDCQTHFFDSYIAKFDKGKLVDIVDLNTEKAQRYLNEVERDHDYKNNIRRIAGATDLIVSDDNLFDYKKNSEILVKKLKNKDLEYITKAAGYIAIAPVGFASDDAYKWGAKATPTTKEDFEGAADKREMLFAGALKLRGIQKIQKDRNQKKRITDDLKSKEQKLNEVSEFAGFYEEDPTKERYIKDKARFNEYKNYAENKKRNRDI